MARNLIGMRELAESLKKRQARALASFKQNIRAHGALYLRLHRMTPGQTIQYKRYAITHHHDGTYSVEYQATRQSETWKTGSKTAPMSSDKTAMATANFLFPEGEFISTLREERGH